MHCNILATSVSKHLFLKASLFYPIRAAIKRMLSCGEKSSMTFQATNRKEEADCYEGSACQGAGGRKSNTPPAAKEPPQNGRCSYLFVEEIAKNNVFSTKTLSNI
jgi:hypothetical protein